MAKILICDDNNELRSSIKKYAEFEGYDVIEAYNGIEGVEICQKEHPDIIIIKSMLPHKESFSTVKEIKKTSNIPVIMISAQSDENSEICGFELGNDNYVVKSFSSKEIIMRVNSILKRTPKMTIVDNLKAHNAFIKDGFVAEMIAYKVFINGVQANLSLKEYNLLFLLIRNKNIAVSRETILNEVWGYDYFGDSRTLYTHMKRIRKSLGPYAGLITTIRGFGYRFED